jgi:hypothetical protein
MKLTTSFGQINIISTCIAEVIINQDVEITLELLEEYDAIMAKQFTGNYAVLVNRINNYRYAYEALLCAGSAQNLRAAAIIEYGTNSEQRTQDLKSIRAMDNLNIKEFSGLELGREKAIAWLDEQLTEINSIESTTQSSR